MTDYIARESVREVLLNPAVRGIGFTEYELDKIPMADVEPVRHARWVWNEESEDGYKHHMCSECETDAPFHYTFADYYDEGLDGEWFYVGQRDNGIVEHMDIYCPNCGAKMQGGENEK